VKTSSIICGVVAISFLLGLVCGAGAAFSYGWLEGYERGFRVATGTPDDRPLELSAEQEQAYREWSEVQNFDVNH
jgi:hypothetical protein